MLRKSGIFKKNLFLIMIDFYRPVWLYESLPYLYVAAGAITIAALPHPISLLSGCLLTTAGACVFKMRMGERRDLRVRLGDRRDPDVDAQA